MTIYFERGLSVCGVLLLALALTGCVAGTTDDVGRTNAGVHDGDEAMNTFITDWLQIDDLEAVSGDANLFLNEGDPMLPVGGGDYIDWDELVTANGAHDYQRIDDLGRKDASAFPQADSCVGSAVILDKMDLTYAAIANNNEYVFLGVQRAKNNGDAAYYWLFTREEPELLEAGSNSCASGEDLVYTITGAGGGSGDVLVRGLFRPSANEPAIEVFRANQNAVVYAEVVINVELEIDGAPLWVPFVDPTPDPGDDLVVAVNTSPTEAGALGYAGVVSRDGSLLDEHIFAEAGVPLSAFTGDSHCGNTYWASVLSRPSHSPTSDPKDLIGPFHVNFGATDATATLTPTCSDEVTFEASAVGADGNPVPAEFMACAWDFGSLDCSGEITLALGTHLASVTVIDTRTDCDDTVDTEPVTIYADLGITASGTDECTGTGFGACAVATGGSGGNSYLWAFDPSIVPVPTAACPGHIDAAAGAYTGRVRVADDRGCEASATMGATAYAPLSATLEAATFLCTSDEVTFSLTTEAGGDGNYSYSWTGCSTAIADTCGINPADGNFCPAGVVSVTFGDTSGVCDSLTHEGAYVTTRTIATTTCQGVGCL